MGDFCDAMNGDEYIPEHNYSPNYNSESFNPYSDTQSAIKTQSVTSQSSNLPTNQVFSNNIGSIYNGAPTNYQITPEEQHRMHTYGYPARATCANVSAEVNHANYEDNKYNQNRTSSYSKGISGANACGVNTCGASASGASARGAFANDVRINSENFTQHRNMLQNMLQNRSQNRSRNKHTSNQREGFQNKIIAKDYQSTPIIWIVILVLVLILINVMSQMIELKTMLRIYIDLLKSAKS